MLPFRARGQRGITLIEISLWCAIIAAATAAIFVFSQKASVAAAVQKEQGQVGNIVKAVDSMFALQPNFAALGANGADYLSSRGAARHGLQLTANEDGTPALTTGLGRGQLNLSVWDVVPVSGPAIPNSGYRLAYQGLSTSECTRLAMATYSIAHQVSVDHSGLDDARAAMLATRGQLTVSPDAVADNCSGDADDATVFLYFAPARAFAATTPSTAPPSTRCNPIKETQLIACPAGQDGTVTQERDGTCTGPGNTLVYTAWATTGDTCADAVVAPPTVAVPSTPDNCATVTYSEVAACPAGQTGHILRSRSHDTCAGTYSPWTEDSNSCVVPASGAICSPGSRQQTIACPPGLTGAIVQTQSSHCSSTYAAPVWEATWNTISNTCTGSSGMCTVQREQTPIPCGAGSYGPLSGSHERFLNCVNSTTQSSTWTAYNVLTPNLGCVSCPATTTETSISWSSDSSACPSGFTGSRTWEYETVSTRTVSYTCPTGTTSLPSPTHSAWSTPAATGAIRNQVDNCTASCTAPASSTVAVTRALADENQNVGCGGSDPGDRWMRRSVTQNGTRTTSWACPGPTSTDSDVWGSLVYGAWYETSNTCSTCTPPAASTTVITRALADENQNIGCPSGYSGDHWQRRTVTENGTRTTNWTCPGPTSSTSDSWSGTYTYGAWFTTTNNCVGVCVVPSPSTEVNTETRTATQNVPCPSGHTGTHTQAREEVRTQTRTASCPTTTGPVSWTAWSTWSAWTGTTSWTTTVNTCTPSSPAMCAVQTSFSSGLENGGDGQQTISYSLNATSTYEDFTCFERDGCNPGVVLGPAMTLYAWGAVCQAGDTYMTIDRPFGYTSTDWVTSFTFEFSCEPVSAGNCY